MASYPAGDETYWWEPLPISDVEAPMADSGGRWWLSGGQALDRFLGFASRPHGDIDVSVQRSDWPTVLGIVGGSLEVFSAVNGTLTELGAEPDPGLWREALAIAGGDAGRRVRSRAVPGR